MRMDNTQRYDMYDGDNAANNIIYLPYRYAYESKKYRARRRRRANRSENFWNVTFSVLCLSVLVILFLH